MTLRRTSNQLDLLKRKYVQSLIVGLLAISMNPFHVKIVKIPMTSQITVLQNSYKIQPSVVIAKRELFLGMAMGKVWIGGPYPTPEPV